MFQGWFSLGVNKRWHVCVQTEGDCSLCRSPKQTLASVSLADRIAKEAGNNQTSLSQLLGWKKVKEKLKNPCQANKECVLTTFPLTREVGQSRQIGWRVDALGMTGTAPPSSWHLLWGYPLDFSVPRLAMIHSSPRRLWFGFIMLERMSGCFNDVTILHCDMMWSPDTDHNQSVWMSHVYISASLARDPEPARCVKGVLQRVL